MFNQNDDEDNNNGRISSSDCHYGNDTHNNDPKKMMNHESYELSTSSSKLRFLILGGVCILVQPILLLVLLQTSSTLSSNTASSSSSSLSTTTTTTSVISTNNLDNESHLHLYNNEVHEDVNDHDDVYFDDSIISANVQQKNRQIQNGHKERKPQFVGEWERIIDCPLKLGEAHGGIINNRYLLVTGGFINDTISGVNRKTFVLDAAGDNLTGRSWVLQDEFPYPLGVTHAAEAFYKDKMFICGGYDGYPGLAQDDCYVFDRRRRPNRTNLPQYIPYPSLPAPRAGGGLVYDVAHDALLFVGGTRRNVTKDTTVILDMNDTFILYLNDTFGGWKNSTRKKPYAGNHLSFVTVNDTCTGSRWGVQRHYIFGGQIGQNESASNLKNVYEYNFSTDEWIQRQSMPFGRGHTGTSVIPTGCGFIVAGGAINNAVRPTQRLVTDDISYYSVVSDTWISIGKLPRPLKTPVCGIIRNTVVNGLKMYFYCTTGYSDRSYRRQLLPTVQVVPVSSPVSPPVVPTPAPMITSSPQSEIPVLPPSITTSEFPVPPPVL